MFVILCVTGWINPIANTIKTYITGLEPDTVRYPCEVRFIDVGQGDSTLILSDGYSILIDAGENDKGDDVVDYLNRLEIRELDLIIATHPHSDHIGGLDVVLRSIPAKRVIMPKLPDKIVPTTKTYTDFLLECQKLGIKPEYAKTGQRLEFGKGVFTVMSPSADLDSDNLNHYSVVTRFVYDNHNTFMFTGDAESKNEKIMLDTYGAAALQAHVLKLGHHGSSTSTTKSFYKAVNPLVDVILLSADNTYGFPTKKTMETIASNGAEVFRSDYHGDITIGISKDNKLQITYEHQRRDKLE